MKWVAVFAISIGVLMTIWVFSRARNMLEAWARENGYNILSSEMRLLRRGPFFWTTSKNQVVYYVTVQTPDGHNTSGFVRCGGFWWGVFTDKVEVRWEN